MPSATRWCPTPEQVMTLEEIFKRGVTTPKPLQVQRITSYLSSYGKIQGKNVFYWFQNRKATERQKLRKKHQELVQYFKHYDHSTADAAAFMTTVQSRQCSSSKEGQQEVPTHELSKTWKEYVPEKWIRLDCGNSTTDKTIDSPSTTRTTPPKTLELFPTKSMYSLRDECMPLQN